MKTRDDRGNWSGLSNVPSGETLCGGGGLAASKTNTDAPLAAEPVAAVPVAERRTEVVWLGGAAKADGGHLIRVANAGAAAMVVDSLALVGAVPSTDRMAISLGDRLGLGEPTSAPAVVSSHGGDVAPGLGSDGGYGVPQGEKWVVSRPSGTMGPTHLRVGTSGVDSSNGAESCGIEVQRPDRTGAWMAGERRHPSPGADLTLWRDVDSDSVRLVFHGGYRVTSVDWLLPSAGTPSVESLGLEAAYHSRLGELPPGSAVRGTEAAILLPGEVLMLRYGGSPHADRELFFALATLTGTSQATRSTPVGEAVLPPAFALWPSAPNPASDASTIRFDLPAATHVRLEVYDLQGRRVATLVDGRRGAGSHVVQWDLAGIGPERIAAGVYQLRLDAGASRAQRKLVVLP